MWLNTIEYVNSESSSLFFDHPCVERQMCIVNRGYAIVTEQQWLDWTNKFHSTLFKKRLGEQGEDTAICNKENHG
jgi:hypothetical protein